jgi:hypothetical protein
MDGMWGAGGGGLVPQGMRPQAAAAQAEQIMLDAETSDALTQASRAALATRFMVRRTSAHEFRERPEVKGACSDTCNDLHDDFARQGSSEERLIEENRRLERERRQRAEKAALALLDDDARAARLATRAGAHLERCLNMFRGYMHTVQDHIDRAVDTVEAADAEGRGDDVSPTTRALVRQARAQEHLHNWAYSRDLARLALEALLRERTYLDILAAHGIVPPFERPLAGGPLPAAVYDHLSHVDAPDRHQPARSRYADRPDA